MRSRYFVFPFVFSIVQMFIAYFLYDIRNVNMQYVNLLIYWILLLYYAYKGKDQSILMLFFLATFFVFLLGNDFFVNLFNLREYSFYSFDDTIYSHVYYSMHVSLFFVFLGSVLFYNKRRKIGFNCSGYKLELLKKYSKKVFYYTLPLKIIAISIAAYNMIKFSYVDLEANKMSSVYIIDRLAQINYLSFVLFLMLYPSKRELMPLLRWGLVVYSCQLLGGSRGDTMYFLIFIMAYLLFRDYINKREGNLSEIFLTNKIKAYIILSAIPLLFFFKIYASIRVHETVESKGMMMGAMEFFVQQGGSYSVIGYAKQYEHLLPSTNISYTFGPVIEFVKKIVPSQIESLEELTHEALYGNNLGATITFLVDPSYYYRGGGFGTQYIAELYTDFGYWGVAVFSLLLGIFISKINFFFSRSWMVNALFASCIISLFSMPRNFYLCWFGSIFSFWNIFFLLAMNVYVNRKIAKRRQMLSR